MSTPPPADRGPTRPGAPPRGLTPFVVVIGIAVVVVVVAMLARRDSGTPPPDPATTTASVHLLLDVGSGEVWGQTPLR